MSPPPVVEIREVSKRFPGDDAPVEALESVSAEVGRREFVSLVGPSGCGKSTLLNLAGGLMRPSEGKVLVNGRPVAGPPAEVGVMFQNPVLLDWRTARENVLLPIQVDRGRRAARTASGRADELLGLAGLRGFEQRYPSELSGGMQQRVALCRMLIADPEVLLLDEPFGALDELTRERMNVELAMIVADAAKTAILVTHNIQEAVYLSDRVFVMTPRPGRIADIVEVGLPRPRSLDLLTTESFQLIVRRVRTALDLGAASNAGDTLASEAVQ